MTTVDALQPAAVQGGTGEPAAAVQSPTEPKAGGEQVSDPGPSPAEIEAEARAKSSGWRGPSPQFPDANSWNEHAERNLPLIQANARKLEAELAKLKQADEERERRVEERIGRAVQIAQANFERQQTNDRASLERRWDNHIANSANQGEIAQRLAQKSQALAAFDAQAAKDRAEHEKAAKVEAATPAQAADPERQKVWETWVSENDWFEQDEELTALAVGLAQTPHYKSLPFDQALAWASQKVKASPLYVAKHGRSAPPLASAVGITPPRGPNGQFVADNVSKLSPEDKRDFDYIWKSLNGAPYQGETDKEKALRKFADKLLAKA